MFEEIKHKYTKYNNWVQDFQGGANISQRLMRLFSHNREFNSKPEHKEFYNSVKELAGRYLEEAKENGTDVYELLNYVFIECYAVAVKASTFMFLAAEQEFIPFLDLLTRDELVQLEEDYKKRRKKDPGLPIQTRIKKRIRQLCSEKA